jgi:hypothetical protein
MALGGVGVLGFWLGFDLGAFLQGQMANGKFRTSYERHGLHCTGSISFFLTQTK